MEWSEKKFHDIMENARIAEAEIKRKKSIGK